MTAVREKWTGSVAVDTEAKILHIGSKQVIPLDEVEDAAVCSAAVRFGKKDVDKSIESVLLCLHLKTPLVQPGRITPRKGHNLTLRLERTEDAWSVLEAMGFVNLPRNSTDISIDRCIVEAKRGCCDYIRGGTVGSNPYGKAGLVCPIITPELNLTNGTIVIRYLGVNSRDRESIWFSAHPAETFTLSASTDTVYVLSLRERGCIATALYQRMDIEHDENATGLWYVSLETAFDSVCDGARWLSTLRTAAGGGCKKEPILPDAESSVTQNGNPAPGMTYDKAMLLAALDLLHVADVLTEEEWRAKRADLERRK